MSNPHLVYWYYDPWKEDVIGDEKVFVPKRHQQLGKRARDRAMKRAGSARITDAAWSPEINHLTELGLTNPEIAAAVQLSQRRVREIKQYATEGSIIVVPEVVQYEELDDDVKAMMEFSADGFKRFYERFSGYTLPAHCYGWVQEFCAERNLMLNVPPRHMKSSVFSLWIPVWLLCRDRDEKILLVSLTKESAKKWVAGIAEQLAVNDAIVSTFGRFRPERIGDQAWRPLSGTLMVSGRKKTAGVQYSVESRGSGQQILGMEATVVLVDDVTDKKIAENKVAREKQIDWLRGDVLSRVETQQTEASGRAVIIGQRLHVHDLYGEFQNQVYERGHRTGEPLWKTIKTPAIRQWPDENPEDPEPRVLWPEKWTYDELMVTYERIGGHATFSAMYQQQPLAEGSDIFRPEWWARCRDHDRKGGEGVRAKAHEAVFPVARVLSIDPSVKMYHGLVVADVLYDPSKFMPVVLETKRWKGPQRSIISEISRCLNTYRPDYFIFEDVSFIQWLKEDPFYDDIQKRTRVLPHQTGRNKGDADMGVESLAREAEFGYIRLPYKDEYGRDVSQLLEDEANEFPYGNTSDILMALWFIKWNYKKLRPVGLNTGKLNWMPKAAENVWSAFQRRSA